MRYNMIKKINILLLLLLILLSIGAVSAVDDLDISIDSNSNVSDVLTTDADVLSEGSHTITQDTYGMYFDRSGNLIKSTVNEGDTIYLDGSISDLKFTIDKK